MTYILGRHYELVSWDAIMTSILGRHILGRHYELVSWDAIMTCILGRHYDLVSWTPL